MRIDELSPLPSPLHGLYEVGVNQSTKRYYAIRSRSPMFCVEGESAEDVSIKAGRAIEAYFASRAVEREG